MKIPAAILQLPTIDNQVFSRIMEGEIKESYWTHTMDGKETIESRAEFTRLTAALQFAAAMNKEGFAA